MGTARRTSKKGPPARRSATKRPREAVPSTGSLIFTRRKAPKSPSELTDLERAQLTDAWERYAGEAPDLAGLLTAENTIIALWSIAAGDSPRYDFWSISDSGALYHAGTTRWAGIQMVQFGWDPFEITPEVEAECRALDDGAVAAGLPIARYRAR